MDCTYIALSSTFAIPHQVITSTWKHAARVGQILDNVYNSIKAFCRSRSRLACKPRQKQSRQTNCPVRALFGQRLRWNWMLLTHINSKIVKHGVPTDRALRCDAPGPRLIWDAHQDSLCTPTDTLQAILPWQASLETSQVIGSSFMLCYTSMAIRKDSINRIFNIYNILHCATRVQIIFILVDVMVP